MRLFIVNPRGAETRSVRLSSTLETDQVPIERRRSFRGPARPRGGARKGSRSARRWPPGRSAAWMRCRAAMPSRDRASGARSRSSSHARPAAPERAAARPAPSRRPDAAESPTSVATHGTPHAMASPRQSGNASLMRRRRGEVEARLDPRDVPARAQEMTAVARDRALRRPSPASAFPRSTWSPQSRKWTAGERRPAASAGGAEERLVVLHRVVPRDQPDERDVRTEAELPAHLGPRRRVGWKAAVSKPLGMTDELLGRRSPAARTRSAACSEQQTIASGSRRDSRAHAATVSSVVRLVTPRTWREWWTPQTRTARRPAAPRARR